MSLAASIRTGLYGAMQRVSKTTLSVAGTTITISGLDTLSDGEYFITLNAMNNAAVNSNIVPSFNGDTTTTNYWTRASIENTALGTTTLTNDQNLSYCGVLYASQPSTIYIRLLLDRRGKALMRFEVVEGENGTTQARTGWIRWVTAANVTSITFTVSGGAQFSAGDFAEVLKVGAVPAAADYRSYGSGTFDPYFTHTGITLSNGDRDAMKTEVGSADRLARVARRIDDGYYYWEFVVVASGASRYNMLGIVPEDAGVTSYPGLSGVGVGYYGNDGKLYGPVPAGASFGSTFTAGDVIGVAYAARRGMIWFAKNNVWQNSGNPAAFTSPAASNVKRGQYPAASIYEGGSVSKIRVCLKASDCTYSAPSGFSYLDS